MANNFIKYRQELAELVGGGVRGEGGDRSVNVLMYSACTFRDLTYIEELKDWRDKDKEFINWKKMEMLFEVSLSLPRPCNSLVKSFFAICFSQNFH